MGRQELSDHPQDDSLTPDQRHSLPIEPPLAKLPPDLQMGISLGVGSLVLGLVSLPLSVFVIGAVTGLVGIVLAIVHLKKTPYFRAMAVWGLVLSGIGFLTGAGLATFYVLSVYHFREFTENVSEDPTEQLLRKFVGAPAPELTVQDIEGNQIKLKDLKGRRVVLDFWATWCPPCRMELPHFINLRKEISPDQLVIIGVSEEDKEKLREFVLKNNINYTIATAVDLSYPYTGISSIPTTLFIDRNGVIQDVLVGYHSFEELKERALAADYQPEPNESLSTR